MKLLVISDAPLLTQQDRKEAYAPYVKEMNLWFKYADEVQIIAPTQYDKPLLTAPFDRQDFTIKSVRRLEFHHLYATFKSILSIPYQFVVLCFAFAKADHIHLRCPGNLALLASIAQVLFPNKTKTAKYAGNWDPEASQPLAYRWQRQILSNVRFTKNMNVLVYGNWPSQSVNIKPFFTASYHENEKQALIERNYSGALKALYVGTLSENKRPLEVLQIIYDLRKSGIDISLDMYGDGTSRELIENTIKQLALGDQVVLHGNQPLSTVTEAYKKSHFAFLLSKSEGWPKAVAEPMFWGSIPIATPVSCMPWMLNLENHKSQITTSQTSDARGIIVLDLNNAATIIKHAIQNKDALQLISKNASEWSHKLTNSQTHKLTNSQTN